MGKGFPFALALVTFAVFACSSSEDAGAAQGKAHCAAGSRGCRCESSSFTLQEDERTATECGNLTIAGDVECCYDLDSDGFTTTCNCATYVCVQTPTDESNECICGWSSHPSDRQGEVVTTCEQTATNSLCCEDVSENVFGTQNACSCNGAYTDCATRPDYEKSSKVSACGVVARQCDSGMQKARSCEGLKWKPPAPPSSSSSSSSSGSSPECTSDSACSGKCSSSCYACRSGDCKCGRKGVSGSCLY